MEKITETTKKTISYNLSPENIDFLKQVAKEDKRSASAYLDNILSSLREQNQQ